MCIEYLSKFIFWEPHSHIDEMLLCLNLELVISGQTHSIIFEAYYWVVCNTCDSWNSYFGEFHGTFHILCIIGLNEYWFMFFFKNNLCVLGWWERRSFGAFLCSASSCRSRRRPNCSPIIQQIQNHPSMTGGEPVAHPPPPS